MENFASHPGGAPDGDVTRLGSLDRPSDSWLFGLGIRPGGKRSLGAALLLRVLD